MVERLVEGQGVSGSTPFLGTTRGVERWSLASFIRWR